jgi:tetratricopeptide (TPR) repeat protein
LRLLAECAQQQSDLKNAQLSISQAELLDPWNLEILIIAESIREAQANQVHHAHEQACLSSELNSGVVNADKLMEQARGSFKLGDLDRAYSLSKLSYLLSVDSGHLLLDIWGIGCALDPGRTYAELIHLEATGDKSPFLSLAIGSTCNVIGNYDEAVSWINKGITAAAEVSPADPYALGMLYNELAYVLAKQGVQLDHCVTIARTALETFPDPSANGFIRDTLGVVYLKKGEIEKAIHNLREAVAKDPTVIPRFHLAMALLQQQDAVGALAELKVVAAARPSLESPHLEETVILDRVQSSITRLEDLLNLGGSNNVRDALEILGGLV